MENDSKLTIYNIGMCREQGVGKVVNLRGCVLRLCFSVSHPGRMVQSKEMGFMFLQVTMVCARDEVINVEMVGEDE